MKKIYYEKKDDRYVPVSEYDSDFVDSFAKGTHLVMVYPGGSSRRFNVDPNYAAMIAAGRVAEDAISRAIVKATEIRRQGDRTTPLTESQKEAWQNLIKEFGPSAKQLEWPSARGAAEEVIKKLAEEADKMLKVPSVKHAYEQFMLVYKLTKDEQNDIES